MTNKKRIYLMKGILILALASGTFYSHKGDLPPLYVKKVGNSAGICAGLITHIEEGAVFNGAVISLVNGNEGTINGINLAGFVSSKNTARINGLEASIASFEDNGSWSGNREKNTTNNCEKVYGAQIGIAANNSGGYNLQIGGFLRNTSSSEVLAEQRRALLLNYRFGEVEK